MANANALLNVKQPNVIILLVFATTRLWVLQALGAGGKIGVDYGLNGDNLLSPKQTVALLRSKGISRVRMYDARQEITQAFANSGIDLMIGIPNDMVPKIAGDLVEAINWVTQNVAKFPNSGISAIIVGNEWLHDPSHDALLLLPAMLNVYTALTTTSLLNLDLSGIKVSTSHALNVLGISFPPSAGAFDGGLLSVLSPLLKFLDQTGSFFMVNVFPYFAYVEDPNVSLKFALFEATQTVQDPKTKLNYTNLFDMQLDAVYAAIDGANVGGLGQVNAQRSSIAATKTRARSNRKPRVLVGESGWPSGAGASGSVPHALLNSMPDALLPSASLPPPASADVSPTTRGPATSLPSRGGVINRTCSHVPSSTPSAGVISRKHYSTGDVSDAHHEHQPPLTPCSASSGVDHDVSYSGGRPTSLGSSDDRQRDVKKAKRRHGSGSAVRGSDHDNTTAAGKARTAAGEAAGEARTAAGEARTAAGAGGGNETGCAASGRVCTAATVENARTYNQNLIRHVLQASGTPANPTTPIEAYIFALFDEDLKPPGPEQHYGLFFPNATPVYPIIFH